MQVKRVDVNIWRATWLKIVSLELLREKKTNCLSQLYQITQLFLITTNWSKTVVRAQYKIAKLIAKKKNPFNIFKFFEELSDGGSKMFLLILQW